MAFGLILKVFFQIIILILFGLIPIIFYNSVEGEMEVLHVGKEGNYISKFYKWGLLGLLGVTSLCRSRCHLNLNLYETVLWLKQMVAHVLKVFVFH